LNKFDVLNDWIRDTENSIVNFLSAFAPWLAPLVPAYMTYQHAIGTLEFPQVVAVPAALVVEILGFSAVSTYLAFWFYNRRNPAASKKAPIILVIIAFGFYLTLIVFSNVLLDSFPGERWAEIVVRALFTLQTIPAAMLVSVRTQHRELLSEISKEKRERLETKNGDSRSGYGNQKEFSNHFRNTSGSNSEIGRPSIHQERVFSYLEDQYGSTGEVPSFSSVAKDLNLPQSTASRLRNKWINGKEQE